MVNIFEDALSACRFTSFLNNISNGAISILLALVTQRIIKNS